MMRWKGQQFWPAAVLFAAFLLASCSTQSRIRHYRGDGTILANPSYGLTGGGGGYTLSFQSIKLDHLARSTFHFSGLPKSKAEVFFVIESAQKWEQRNYHEWNRQHYPAERRENTAIIDDLNGTLDLSLRDAKGKCVLGFKKKLRDLTWSSSGLYDQNAVSFTPDGSDYDLEITIDPDHSLEGASGHVIIRGGGWEPVSIGL